MFGDLTTVTLGYKRGWNDVYRNVKNADGSKTRDPTFADQVDTRGYSLGRQPDPHPRPDLASQLRGHHRRGLPEQPLSLGALRGLWRSPRIRPAERDLPAHAHQQRGGRSPEVLPALSGGRRGQLPLLHGYVGRAVPVRSTSATPIRRSAAGCSTAASRYYSQTAADFYRDLFPRRDFANFMARDKELATYNSYTIGVGASYEFNIPWAPVGAEEHAERPHRSHHDRLRRLPRRHGHESRQRHRSRARNRSSNSTRTFFSSSCLSGSDSRTLL